MKKILLPLLFSLSLYANTVTEGYYIYSFSSNGMPISRINIRTGAVSVISSYGFIDLRFKNSTKMFKDKEFSALSKEKKIKIIRKYFKRGIKPYINDMKPDEQDKNLKVFMQIVLSL